MIRTRVGYAGGTTKSPTYYSLGDHSEVIQIDYDPTEISYEKLLEVFWDSHDPTVPIWSTQYRSIVFCHNEEQERLATATKQRQEAKLGARVLTEVTPFSEFHLAEDYHQKYYLQQAPELMEELSTIYPDMRSFVNSTAVARINGYLGGHGTFEALQGQLSSFGLSPAGSAKLLDIGRRILPGASSTCIGSISE